eukprot:NODE_6816_length_433_cov_179.809896_g5216_i0.p2 GENE.NODE_6816_length_433_cov_179.809896_g5216_i0~~NODE_6816_length_433_cov_179.809896_g5216_i0.p2  ORF type:complete len:110 (-),score=19.53 NODE_6816_length_433_cov_179.809896_g5216_i0:103-408(-)
MGGPRRRRRRLRSRPTCLSKALAFEDPSGKCIIKGILYFLRSSAVFPATPGNPAAVCIHGLYASVCSRPSFVAPSLVLQCTSRLLGFCAAPPSTLRPLGTP